MRSNKKLFTTIIACLLIVIILSSAILVIPFDFGQDTTIVPSDDEPVFEYNSSISPYLNQGLSVEINRIRHRGILDAVFARGDSWKNPPTFHVAVEVDGTLFDYYEEYGDTGLFTTWDTFGQEIKVPIDAEEEQKTSQIKITFYEHTSSLFGLRNSVEQKDSLTLTYDYRTGRWSGDDSFKDFDGYGHFRGENFELWFDLVQNDFDHDGIPFWTEVNILKTNPQVDDSHLDPDGDGIPTSWEWRWGYDPNTWDDHVHLDPDVDGIQNIEEYQVSKWFSDPFSQDIYIETDGMESGGFFDKAHVFWEESQQILMERYASHNINFYVDDGWPDGPINGGGELLDHVDDLEQETGAMLSYYEHHFADERKGIFRYVVVGHDAGFNHPSVFNRYDTIAVGTKLYRKRVITMSLTERTDRQMLAAGIMHELGHSMGIGPWTIEGCDNLSFNSLYFPSAAKTEYEQIWGNYKSVMNYYHIYDKGFVDYSDGSGGENDQNDWESLYLPTYQIESKVFEEVFFQTPGDDRFVDESYKFDLDGWSEDENITASSLSINLDDDARIPGTDLEFKVLVKTDQSIADQNSNRTIRIYVRPDCGTTYSTWSLSYDGYMDLTGSFHTYDTEAEAQKVFDVIGY